MLFSQLIDYLLQDTTTKSLPLFSVELTLSVTVVVLLLLRLFSADRVFPACLTATVGAIVACFFAYKQFDAMRGPGATSQFFFTGLLIHDSFTVYFRGFLSLFLLLTIALTSLTGIPDDEDGPDFYSLLLGATVGMLLMASANSLLMLFVGVEMASVPSYAMVGFLKGRKASSEAALKYVVYGAGAAGVMLYGISLLAGVLGTADMSLLSGRLAEAAAGGSGGLGDPELRAATLGIMLIMVGLAFKLSLVPFHFWCPDAFEGASAEVAGFLSIASKAGAFALLVRLCVALSGAPGTQSLMIAFGVGLGFVACLTATFGNMAAFAQTNLKRLLAYSTIAHAGYMVMAVAAFLVLSNGPNAAADRLSIDQSIEGLMVYLAAYLFMNLGAFAVIAIVRNHTFSEEIDSMKGLIGQSPALCAAMIIFLYSLIGLPPAGGFIGKLFIFGSALKSGSVHWFMYVVVAFGALNTVLCLIYYMRIIRTMVMETRPAEARPVPVPLASWESALVVTLSVFVFVIGIFPGRLSEIARSAAQSLVFFH